MDVLTKPVPVKRFRIKRKTYKQFAGVSCLEAVKFYS